MISRQHYLEIALENAIKANDLETLKILIKRMRKSSGPSLESLDVQGRSFLFFALEESNSDISKTLLSTYEDNDDILFQKDQNGRTLFHIAVLKGHYSIVSRLIEIAERKNKLELYLEEDDEGYAALHHAASFGKDKIVELILIKINNLSRVEIINRVNKEGDTALHCAFKNTACNSVGHLINYGAKLNLNNNRHQTSVMLYANLTQEKQVEIFLFLNKEKQGYVLQCYRKLLIDSNMPENLKNNYFKLASLQSLQALLIAHHEFNSDIPVRNHFITSTIKSENKDSNGKYVVIEKEEYVSDTILKRMPIYEKKVLFAEKTIEEKNSEKQKKNNNSTLVEAEETNIILNNQSNDEILDTDRVTLINLIEDIENYLNDLRRRPFTSTSNKALAILIPIVTFLFYLGIESWVSYKTTTVEKFDPNIIWPREFTEEYYGYMLSSVIFGVLGFFIWLGSSLYVGGQLWKKEPNISRHEWEPIIDKLQLDLIEKLQDLENKEKLYNEKYLITQPQNLRDLEGQVKALEEYIIHNSNSNCTLTYPSQPISKVIQIFTRLKNILEQIQFDLNLSKKPFSLFFKPPITIYVGSDYDSDDELLQKDKNMVLYTASIL